MLVVQIRSAQPELDPRVTRFSSTIQKHGWSSTIICWNRGPKESSVKLVNVNKVFSTPISLANPPFWVMPFLLALFYLKCIPVLVRLRPKICVAHQLDVLALAMFLRLLTPGVKVIFDNEDVYSLMISRDVPILIRSIIHRLESKLASRADLCVFPNSAMRSYVEPLGATETIVLPNIPEIGFAAIPDGKSPPATNEGRGFTITYFGLITHDRGLEILIRAIARLLNQGINARCLLIGAGPLVQELKDLSSAHGIIDKVQFTGRVKRESIPNLVSACDASAILNSIKDPMNIFGDPNKLYESMILGVPVIASNFGEIARIVKESDCGILVDPEDENSVAEAIVKLSENTSLRQKLSRNGREVMRTKYSWESLGHALIEAINRLAPSP